MTRWARGNKGNSKRPHEASSWNELKVKSSDSNQRQKTKRDKDDAVKPNQQNVKKRRRKRKAENACKEDAKEDEHNSSILETPTVSDEHIQEDGGSLKPSLSERLTPLGGALGKDDKTAHEMHKKKDRRREERRQKRIKHKANKMVCYNCREAGHGVSECPKVLLDEEQGTGICFRCGSTEHEANRCTARVDPGKGEFPFAKCFICQETGHLSKTCPDNPRGLYPLGGGCKRCGSVEHWSQNCPDSTDAKNTNEMTLPTLDSTLSWSADADIDDMTPTVAAVHRPPVKKTPKVVKF